MSILEAIVAGVVQGITEFLPISSSGHLVILHAFFGYTEPRILEYILLHAGTLVAIIIFFRNDILRLFRDRRLFLMIAVGTVPIVIVGFLFGKYIEPLFASTKAVGIALLVTGFWILAGELISRSTVHGPRPTKIRWWQALFIGIAQAVALFPGISRSGATISTGLLCGKKRDEVFRFSFLLSIPALIGASLYKAAVLSETDLSNLGYMILGAGVSCIVGIAALWLLRNILMKKELYYFSVYCWVIGLITLFARG